MDTKSASIYSKHCKEYQLLKKLTVVNDFEEDLNTRTQKINRTTRLPC